MQWVWAGFVALAAVFAVFFVIVILDALYHEVRDEWKRARRSRP